MGQAYAKSSKIIDSGNYKFLYGNGSENNQLGDNFSYVRESCQQFFFFSLALQSSWALASDFQFRDTFTDGRIPWRSDQPLARPLPEHRTTQTQNKHIPNIHSLYGIRTHDPGFRASEDSTCHDRMSAVTRVEFITDRLQYVIRMCMLQARNKSDTVLRELNLLPSSSEDGY
jgi:hypothetical protein